MNWIEQSLGYHAKSIMLAEKRAELLATNLANSDTPGYKALDIDFRSVLASSRNEFDSALRTTSGGHISGGIAMSSHVFERDLEFDSDTGNTVSKEFEQSAFTENSVRYMASLRFMNGSVQGLLKALRGD